MTYYYSGYVWNGYCWVSSSCNTNYYYSNTWGHGCGSPTDDCEVLLEEDFRHLCDPDDSRNILSDGHWDVRYGKLYTDGNNDGTVLFKEVHASDPVEVTFDIKSVNAHRFEHDDSLRVEAKIDGEWVLLDEFRVNEHTNTFVGSESGQTFNDHGTELTYKGGALDDVDDTVQLRITSDISWHDEKFYIDNVEIKSCPAEEDDCDNKVDFEGVARGTVAADQFAGVTISAQRAGDSDSSENDAMIFDSDRPTGRDWDLHYADQGNILIISEDNDSHDPDDNAHGGKINFDFDDPSSVESITVLDIEERGGTIDLFDGNGDLIKTVNIPLTGNNGKADVSLDAEGVDRMVVNLAGSGAVDDLCFTPDPNTDPEAMDDEAAVCADAAVDIDVLGNDSDADMDDLVVHSINGQDVMAGDTVTLDSGAEVTVNDDGTLSYDTNGAYDDLLIGDDEMDMFSYTASDGNGGEASANVDVKVCGALNTVETIADRVVPDEGCMTVSEGTPGDFSVTLSDTGVAALDQTFEQAYCVDFDAPLPGLIDGAKINVDIEVAGGEPVDYDVTSANQFSPDLEEDVDNIGWILNEDFGSQGYSEAEIQAAIWGITNLTVKDVLVDTDNIPDKLAEAIGAAVDAGDTDSSVEDAMEIYERATTEGEGYEATEAGDIVALILTPQGDDGNVQPFVVGVDFEDLEEDCECDLLV